MSSTSLSRFEREIANQGSEIEKHNTKIHELEQKLESIGQKLKQAEYLIEEAHSQLQQHDFAFEMLLDVRENIFSAALRSHSEKLQLSPTKYLLHNRPNKLQVPGPPSFTGGYAAMDAILILERQYIDWLIPYKKIYGVEATIVKDIAEAGYPRVLRVLDVVGGYRLNGKMDFDPGEKEVFDEIIHMISFWRLEAATSLSRKFPFKTRSRSL